MFEAMTEWSRLSRDRSLTAAGVARRAVAIVGGLAVLLLCGFVIFVWQVGADRAPRTVADADAIIVLTGGQARLEPAVQLLAEGRGERQARYSDCRREGRTAARHRTIGRGRSQAL